VWAIVPFLLFSVAGSKRAVYLLPSFPAYAMLIAAAWARVVRERPAPVAASALFAGAATSAAVVALAAMLVLAGTAGLAPEDHLRGLVSHADVANVAPMMEATREHRAVVIPCAIAMLAAAWIMIRAGRSGRWARVLGATAVAMLALSVTVSTTLLPALASKRSHRAFLARVEQLAPQSSPLSFYRSFDYGAVFYRGAPIPVRQALTDVPEIDGAWLLTQPAQLPALAEEARQLDTGANGAAGAYEVRLATADGMKAFASEDVGSSSSLVLVRIERRIDGQEHERAGGN
jgi:4-amino-4-deoxy-L-arabinose transferase-like glycosyltransferase